MQGHTRLNICLIVSLCIHVLSLTWLHLPIPPPPVVLPTLTVQLLPRPVEPTPVQVEPVMISQPQQTARPAAARRYIAVTPAPTTPTTHTVPSSTPSAVPVDVPPSVAATPKLDLDQLRQQARSLVHDDNKPKPTGTQNYNVLNELNNTLRQPAREMRLANGMIKLINADGSVICFQPPPIYARDVPGLYGIPMSCP